MPVFELSDLKRHHIEPAVLKRLMRLSEWRFEPVAQSAQRRLEWDDAFTGSVLREYVRFLALCILEPHKSYGMAGPVDEIWHEHLDNQRNYADFCSTIIGYILVHEPLGTSNIANSTQYYANNTYQDLSRYFGLPPSQLWPDPSASGFVAKCCKGHAYWNDGHSPQVN